MLLIFKLNLEKSKFWSNDKDSNAIPGSCKADSKPGKAQLIILWRK